MRVAYICADPGVPVFGCKGCSVHVQEMLRTLLRHGAQVDLFAARKGGSRSVLGKYRHGVTWHAIPKGTAQSASSGKVAGHSRDAVDRIAKRERHWLSANQWLDSALDKALDQAGPFDLVYERYALWSYAGMQWARRRQILGILEVNSPLIDEQATYRRLINRGGAERATRHAMEAAGAAICVSRQVAEYVNRFRDCRRETHILPNGVDPRRFESPWRSRARGNRADPSANVVVGFVGTLKPWHGVADLVEAFAIAYHTNPGLRLRLIGDGPQRGQLEAQVDALPLAVRRAVQFVGPVPPAEIPERLASIDIGVAPYQPMDNFYFSPLKLFEYMAAGLPTVASRVGQIDDVLEDGRNGCLYQAGNIRALAASLERLSRDGALRERLGGAARQTVLDNHTWDRVLQQVLAMVDRLRGTTRSDTSQAAHILPNPES
jgi:glycosyltransferase involved in cell wall biosynthesis